MQSAELNELFTALALAQGEGLAALKDQTGQIGQQKTKYADLASCWEACRAPLAKHGICVVQVPSSEGAKVTIETILGHKSGQFISGLFSMTSTVATPQGMGSAVTYARRYSLCSMVGIAPEDDDGAAASQQGSREGAKAVGESKVRQMKANQADAKDVVGDLGVSESDVVGYAEMLKGFQAIKAEFVKMGAEPEYYKILGAHGFEKSNQIKSTSKGREIYKEMGQRRKDLIEEMSMGGAE